MRGTGGKREDDWTAFEAEALPWMRDVFRVARMMTGDRSTAEDLTQETFIEALKGFHGYTPDTNCRAWLMTILYRANGRRRVKLGRLKLVEDPDDLIAETVPYVTPRMPTLTDGNIIAALMDLSEMQRAVVLLTDIEEFTYREVAEILGIPVGTVMSRLHRGRRTLKQTLCDVAVEYGIAAKPQTS